MLDSRNYLAWGIGQRGEIGSSCKREYLCVVLYRLDKKNTHLAGDNVENI